MLFFTILMNLSTSPFACTHPGVTFQCLNPCSLAYSANFLPLKGGPLSIFILSRTPHVVNIFSIMGTTHSVDVVDINSTTGIHKYWSHDTNAMQLPKGPAKSALIFFHGPLGKVVILKGSLWCLGLTASHAIQHFQSILSTLASIPGNHTWALNICFVWTIPSYP